MKDLVTKIEFFSGLDDKIIKRIADACIMRQYTRNETIVRQGEMGLGVYVISRGHVKVEREQGGKKTQVAELGPEQCFGEMSLLDNKPRSATVTATEDAECLLLTRDSINRLMNKHPEIPMRMARVLAERLRVANEKLAASGPTAPSGPTPVKPGVPGQPPPSPSASTDPAPVPVPANAAAASVNGATPPENSDDLKSRVKKTVLETFSSLYTVKAMTRFTVAVIGCPVQPHAENAIGQMELGDVKVMIFPAEEPVDMKIAAYEDGDFTLAVFAPWLDGLKEFGPVGIRVGDDVHLDLTQTQIALRFGAGCH